MRKILTAFTAAVLLAGCAGLGKKSRGGEAFKNPRSGTSIGQPPAFALPGVPLKSEFEAEQAQAAAARPAAAPVPAETPAQKEPPAPKTQAAPAPDVKPQAAASAADNGKDLDFHLSAARKYASKKKYLSAAAEYKAALAFIPAGNALAVHALERQGAMMLRAGNNAKAKENFAAAIDKAREIGAAGEDLANAHLGLAYCLEMQKNLPEAIKNYERVLQLSSSKVIKARVSETIEGLKKGK